MFDMRCPKCGKRFGFRGEKITECPPCPSCKHQIPKETLQKDQEKMDKIRAELLAEDD